ncbi:TlpA family protein disulfide reductase [Duganella sp. PWIR1]
MLSNYDFSMEKRKTGDQGFAVVRLKAKQTPVAPIYKVKFGSAFPKFKLHSVDGTLVTNDTLLGRYTLISFYFAECSPCIKEVPMLNAFAKKHKDVTTLAVTFDSMDEAKGFAKRMNFNWRTVVKGNNLIEKVGVRGYPTFALIDPKGNVVTIGDQLEIGAKNGALEKWVEQAINRN